MDIGAQVKDALSLALKDKLEIPLVDGALGLLYLSSPFSRPSLLHFSDSPSPPAPFSTRHVHRGRLALTPPLRIYPHHSLPCYIVEEVSFLAFARHEHHPISSSELRR